MKAKLKVPTELNDISLKQYQEYLKAVDKVENKDLIQQITIEHFCEIPLSNVLLIQMADVTRISNDIDEMFREPKPLYQTFKIGGQEFGMIPNLEEMTFGEYVDLDSYVTDWQKMHKAMAVLFRPITTKIDDKYEILPYKGSDEFSELMQFAPLGVVMGAMVFFWNLGQDLLKALVHYLQEEMATTLHPKHSLHNDGDGMHQSIHSLRETLSGLDKLLNFKLGSV